MAGAEAPPRAFAGLADLRLAPRDGRTRLVRAETRPPLLVGRALYPDEALPDLAQIIIANPTAGIFAGDRLRVRVGVAPGGRAHLTTQGATRIHTMPNDGARQAIRLEVAEGAALEWLPDLTIPFAGARFTQATTAIVAPGGTLIYGDILMPGRIASGELLAYTRLTSRLTVARPVGPPLYREAFSLVPGARSPLGRALLGQAPAALGTFLIVSDAIPAEALREAVRGVLQPSPGDNLHHGVAILPGSGGICLRSLAAESAPITALHRLAWARARDLIWGVGLPPQRKY